jgi:hypothetical protein
MNWKLLSAQIVFMDVHQLNYRFRIQDARYRILITDH